MTAHAAVGSETKNGTREADAELFTRVAKIFQDACLECHNGRDRQGELSLEDQSSFRSGGESGAVIDDHDWSSSALLRAVTPVQGKAEMPKDKPSL